MVSAFHEQEWPSHDQPSKEDEGPGGRDGVTHSRTYMQPSPVIAGGKSKIWLVESAEVIVHDS